VPLEDLNPLTPQLHTWGLQVTQRDFAPSGAVADQGRFVEFLYNMVEDTDTYQDVLNQYGLLNQTTAQVTVYVQNQVYELGAPQRHRRAAADWQGWAARAVFSARLCHFDQRPQESERMTVQWRTGGFNTSTITNPLTYTAPGGGQEGDLMLLQVCVNMDCTVTVPAGWTLVQEVTGTFNIRVYSKVVGPSEPATYQISNDSVGGRMSVAMAVVSSSIGDDLIVLDSASQNNPSGHRLWPSIQGQDGAFLLCFACLGGIELTTQPAGMTERWDYDTNTRTY
jgi:hypothetical protein